MVLFAMMKNAKKPIQSAGYTLNIKFEKEEMMFIFNYIQEK